MSNEEKIQYYRSKTIEELKRIVKADDIEETDMIIASAELGNKEYAQGRYYTPEEVLEHIFGGNNMVGNS